MRTPERYTLFLSFSQKVLSHSGVIPMFEALHCEMIGKFLVAFYAQPVLIQRLGWCCRGRDRCRRAQPAVSSRNSRELAFFQAQT